MMGQLASTEIEPAQRMIKLVPLAMAIPNAEGVYTLSQYQAPKTVTEKEWHTYSAHRMRVGTPENWQWADAYARGLDCWYVAVEG
jgi:hypothetical protein